MAVEVTIHVTEGVIHGMTLLDGTQTALRLDGARDVRYILPDVAQFLDVHTCPRVQVNNHPDGADITQRLAILVINPHVALREMAVVVLNPRGELVIGVHLGILVHLDSHPRQHPHLVVTNEALIAHAPRVGMQRGHLDDAGHQQRQGQLSLGIALASSEIIGLRKLFHHNRLVFFNR